RDGRADQHDVRPGEHLGPAGEGRKAARARRHDPLAHRGAARRAVAARARPHQFRGRDLERHRRAGADPAGGAEPTACGHRWRSVKPGSSKEIPGTRHRAEREPFARGIQRLHQVAGRWLRRAGARSRHQGRMMRVLLLLLFWAGVAHAFPTKPVRIIVAFPPGGGTDIVARLIAAPLGEAWKQPVVVENRAGASGVIGTEAAARAEADGHTLFMATMGNMTANQHLYPKMAIDPLRAFAPITKVVDVHFVFMANPTLPADGVPELVA